MKNVLILKQTKTLQTHTSHEAPSPVKHVISIAAAAVQKKLHTRETERHTSPFLVRMRKDHFIWNTTFCQNTYSIFKSE